MTRIYCVLHTNKFTEICSFVNCFFCCQLYSIHLETNSLTHVESKGPNESEHVESKVKGENESNNESNDRFERKGESESKQIEPH